MYEPYHLIILEQLRGKGWVYKEALKCDLDKKHLEEVLEELSALHFIHLGVGNILLSSKGDTFLKTKAG